VVTGGISETSEQINLLPSDSIFQACREWWAVPLHDARAFASQSFDLNVAAEPPFRDSE